MINILMILVVVLFLISFLLVLIQVSISTDYLTEKTYLSPLESGFESLMKSTYFNLQYFLLAVLFVLFDVELILLLPFLLSISSILWMILVLAMLSITLFLEWKWTGLKWMV